MTRRSDSMVAPMSRRERRRLAKEQAKQQGTHWTQQWRDTHKPPPVMQPLEIVRLTPEEEKALKAEKAAAMVEERESNIHPTTKERKTAEKAAYAAAHRDVDAHNEAMESYDTNVTLDKGYVKVPGTMTLAELRKEAQGRGIRVDGKRPSLCTKAELVEALSA